MYATHSLDKEFFAFGLSKIYILDSLTNITSTDIISTPSDYLGAITDIDISFTAEQEYEYTFIDGLKVLKDISLTSKAVQIKFTLLEANKKNFELFIDKVYGSQKEYRLELIFIYPNRINKLIMILPRCKITTDAVFAFNPESPMPLPVVVSSLYCEDENWIDSPIGKMVFI